VALQIAKTKKKTEKIEWFDRKADCQLSTSRMESPLGVWLNFHGEFDKERNLKNTDRET